MGDKSNIAWTDATWNPIVGCSHISPGCDNCYAERDALAGRLQQFEQYQQVVSGRRWNGKTAFVESQLEKPLHWKRPRKIFVCSMGDIFHPKVQHEWLLRVYEIMEKCPQHTFQICTKRSDRMLDFYGGSSGAGLDSPPLKNLWLGVTAENQEQADKRIPDLLATPAAVRWVSVEPMLGPVDLYDGMNYGNDDDIGVRNMLDWVVCGGESGPNARPLHPAWVRSIRDQCQEADTPFFFKQWGEWAPYTSPPPGKWFNEVVPGQPPNDGEERLYRVGKKQAGNKIDGETWEQFPGQTGGC